MVVAPLDDGREGDLRALLASMNDQRGVVDAQNPVVPFGQFDRLHFARFVILRDETLDDITTYGLPRPNGTPLLAFLGDCDGPADAFLQDLSGRADGGLRRIFSHCRGFTSNCDLLRWMKERECPPSANYINWLGRTVRQIREEEALRQALETFLDDNRTTLAGQEPAEIRQRLREFVGAERWAGRLTLTEAAPTPSDWTLRNALHLVGVPLLLLALAPALLLYAPIFLWQLRRRERTDPEIVPRPSVDHTRRLADLEDHDVTNQFSAIGTVKPGRLRRWTLVLMFLVLNYAARHIFNHGFLTRVNTIHFARWVFLDEKQRMFFASNYDGSLDSYMDDFINKVGWGLNVVFSNGVGYPRTDWLMLGGAKDEQKFKHFLRRHQLPTEVWYNAHPGLTAVDLERNTHIRRGIEQPHMTEAEARDWLALL